MVRRQEEVGLRTVTDGEFRRTSWHMDFIYRWAASRSRAACRSSSSNAEGDSSSPRPRCTIDGARPAAADLRARTSRSCSRARDGADAEADDPLAEHGPLPRRPAAVDRTSTPTSTASGPTWPPPTASEVRAARRARLHATCSSTTRASPTSTTPGQREHIAAASAATPSTCTSSTSATSTSALADRPGGHGRHDAHVPRQLPVDRGWPRAATTTSPRRCSASSTSTASSWSGTTRARAASSRCASCPRASRSCSGSSRPSAASSSPRTTLKRRIEEASQYVDVDQLCLSPQCGFSSTVEGNELTIDEQCGQAAR